MDTISDKRIFCRKLEFQLENLNNDIQKLKALDELISHYKLTNISKAITYLEMQRKIMNSNEDKEIELNYYLNTAFIENQLYNYKESVQFYNKALIVIEEVGTIQEEAEALIDLAGTCINMNMIDTSLHYLEKAEQLLKGFPGNRFDYRILCRKGFINLKFGVLSKSIEVLLEAEKGISNLKSLSNKDHYFRTLILSGLGKIYELNNEPQKSTEAYLKVVKCCQKVGMKSRLSWHYLNLGKAYMAEDNIHDAILYLSKSIIENNDINEESIAGSLANLGYCYFQLNKLNKAKELYNQSYQIYKKNKNSNLNNLSELESMMAQLFERLNNHKKVINHYLRSLKYAKKENNFYQISFVCLKIANYYELQNFIKEALSYTKLYISFREKSELEINKRKIRELEIKFEIEN